MSDQIPIPLSTLSTQSPDNVTLFLITPETTINETAYNCLSVEEQSRAQTYLQPWKAASYRRAKVACRVILSHYLNQTASTIVFSHNRYNKPFVHPEMNATGLHFNMSHTGNQTVLAIAKQTIGVDVEQKTRPVEALALAEQYYHPNELRVLQTASRVNDTFYRFFTRKEAVLKAIGIGLIDELNEIDGSHSCVQLPPKWGQGKTWQLTTFTLLDSLISSVAHERPYDRLVCYGLHNLECAFRIRVAF